MVDRLHAKGINCQTRKMKINHIKTVTPTNVMLLSALTLLVERWHVPLAKYFLLLMVSVIALNMYYFGMVFICKRLGDPDYEDAKDVD